MESTRPFQFWAFVSSVVIFIIHSVIPFTIIIAISSVMAQFERTVDQYRWPGWAVSFIVVFLSVLFLLVYRNVETNPKKGARKGFCLTFRRGLSKKCCSRASLKPLTCRNVIVSSL